jgi:hypothetical protein
MPSHIHSVPDQPKGETGILYKGALVARVPSIEDASDAYHRAVLKAKQHLAAARREALGWIAQAQDALAQAKLEEDLSGSDTDAIDAYTQAEEILGTAPEDSL